VILTSKTVKLATRYPCKACGMIFSTRVGLREHGKVHDDSEVDPHVGYGPIRRWRLRRGEAGKSASPRRSANGAE
jgi:hypothetical protein